MAEMRVVAITKPGGPDVLQLQSRERPAPATDEACIAIKATAVNRADVLQRKGLYPPPAGTVVDVPGLEYAGVVEAVGKGVTNLKVGDRVYGLATGGTYAEYITVHSRTTSPIPENLTFAQAAAIPEAFITAYDAMVVQGGLQCGQTVLVSAVGSGVGTAAVQIARAIGAICIGTARGEHKIESAKRLGLLKGICVGGHNFSDAVLKETGGTGVDVVLELVGGEYVAEDIKCCASKGRIIVVGLVAGAKCEADLGSILRKRLTVRGTTMRMRPLEEKVLAAQILTANLNHLFANGSMKPVIDRVLPLAAASQAHQLMEDNENFGKIVLEL